MSAYRHTGSQGSTPASSSRTSHAALTGDLSVVVGSLHAKYDGQVGAAAVEAEIQQVADRFVDARIRAFVPLFVRRYVGARLRAVPGEQEGSADRRSGGPGPGR